MIIHSNYFDNKLIPTVSNIKLCVVNYNYIWPTSNVTENQRNLGSNDTLNAVLKSDGGACSGEIGIDLD